MHSSVLDSRMKSKGMTTIESLIFNYLYMVAHNYRYEMFTPFESTLLDDCDAAVDNHMSDVSGNILVVETFKYVKSHCSG